MKQIKWYFSNSCEIYNVLYEDDKYILVQNDKYYSFGLKRDFGTFCGFPINQSVLDKEECINRLNSFVEIDKKYNDVNHTMAIYENMLNALKEVNK